MPVCGRRNRKCRYHQVSRLRYESITTEEALPSVIVYLINSNSQPHREIPDYFGKTGPDKKAVADTTYIIHF